MGANGGERVRCEWVRGADALMQAYPRRRVGRPLHNDHALFELLSLEGAQAGLSWQTILRRREGYRAACHGFDIARVARYTDRDQQRLLHDERIIRNRAKVSALVSNARASLALQHERGSLDAYVWSFVGGAPKQNRFRSLSELPAETEESRPRNRER